MIQMNFPPPTDRPTGCLPRTTQPGDVCALARDALRIIVDPDDWDEMLAKMPGGMVDMSDCVGEIYDQDGYGSCTMESWNKAVEVALRASGYQDVPTLNPWFTYGIAVNWRGGGNVGTSIDENFVLLQEIGCCPETVWPRSKGPNRKASEEAYAAALKFKPLEGMDCETIAEVGSALLERHPVVIGWHSHSELLVGLLHGRKVRVCGSYGPTYYGGKGWHDEPISAIQFKYGAIALRTVTDLGVKQ